MSYWGYGPDENDFAFDSLGACIVSIKKRIFQDIANDPKRQYPEQSIIPLLVCLRMIGERFPKNLSVTFRKKHFEQAKEAFYAWYQNAYEKIPEQYRGKVLQEAESEFQLFEERILKKK
jgi:hypothetical protein